jgi:hypothetical protein
MLQVVTPTICQRMLMGKADGKGMRVMLQVMMMIKDDRDSYEVRVMLKM